MVAGILAWLGTCATALTLFYFADEASSLQGKARARELLDFGWKDTVTRWPSVFIEMFDSIFGKRHFTWKCFWRSCVASLVAVVICTLIYMWMWPDYRPTATDYTVRHYIMSVLGLAIIVNFIPDYVSLLETRLILRLLSGKRAKWTAMCTALIADFLATAVILQLGLFGFAFLVLSLSGETAELYEIGLIERMVYTAELFTLEPLVGLDGKTLGYSLGIFVWSTYFTSVWLWLYALATFAGKLLLPILNRIQKGKKYFDLDNKPYLALGWLSVVIITVLFALGAVVKACL